MLRCKTRHLALTISLGFCSPVFSSACSPATTDKAARAGGACVESIIGELFACDGNSACETAVREKHAPVCAEDPTACETPVIAGPEE